MMSTVEKKFAAADELNQDETDSTVVHPFLLKWGVVGFLIIGVSLRLVRYCLKFPLWNDEHLLAENFLDRDYLTLVEPLDNGQVAPLFFLWTELAITRLVGFSEYSLRFFPLLCGIASVFLFFQLARSYLKDCGLLMAVGVFSVSYYPIRHACELKPYAVDTFFTLVVLCLATAYWRTSRVRWLWGLVLVSPLAVGFSFPSVFVLGGVSLTMMKSSFFQGQNRERVAFVVFNLSMVTSFLVLLMTFSNASYEVQFDAIMRDYWVNGYLPVYEPGRIPLWIADVFSSHLLSYPLGGSNGGSTFSLIAFLVGIVGFWKKGETRFLIATGSVIGLALIASAMQRYPFGGHARLMQYFAPIACLLVGSGFSLMIPKIWPLRFQPSVYRFSLGLLMAVGAAILIRDIRSPYKSPHDQRHREFTEKLWNSHNVEQPLYCLMGSEEFPTNWRKCYYRCQQQIVTDGKYETLPSSDELTSSQTYQGVVWCPDHSRKGISSWYERLSQSFEIVDRKSFEMDFGADKAWYEVLTLRPRQPNPEILRSARRISAPNLN